jgi:predicted transcriptional regulator
MEKITHVVEVRKDFRTKVERQLGKHGRRQQFLQGMPISRQALYQFIEVGKVRYTTLQEIVRKVEGVDAIVDNYITKS